MLDKVVKESDFSCSYFETKRLPYRQGYVISFTARFNGKVFGQVATFDQKQMKLIGMKQAKHMVVDALLTSINQEKI